MHPGKNNILPLEVHPVTLTGRVVRLEPLTLDHVPDLAIAGSDESIWQYMLYGSLTTPEKMAAWVQEMLNRQAQGTDLPFAVIHLATGRAIGATRYMDIRPYDRGVSKLGGTWYAVAYQRTAVNTECKISALEHAF